MGNYKSSSNQHLISFSNSSSATAAAYIITSINGKPTSILSSTKLNLGKHFKNLNHQGIVAKDCTDNKENNKENLIKNTKRLKPNLQEITETTNNMRNSLNVDLPKITLKPVDPDHIIVEDIDPLERASLTDQDAVNANFDNFYESTSEILTSNRKVCKSDNYFSIYDENFDHATNQTEADYNANTIIVKSNSTNNLYSEVNLPSSRHKSVDAQVMGACSNKSATLAKTGVNLSKFINNKKYTLQSITKLLQKLTKKSSSSHNKQHAFKTPTKSFDPNNEFYIDLGTEQEQFSNVNNETRPNRTRFNPPKTMPPPLPNHTNLSDPYQASNNINNGFRINDLTANVSDLNNSKDNDVILVEDNYQSVPEYDYIPQVIDVGVESAAGLVDGSPPRPPPASTQPNREFNMSNLYTKIEPFNLKNQVYYSFTSPSGTTFASSSTDESAISSNRSSSNNAHALLPSTSTNHLSSSSDSRQSSASFISNSSNTGFTNLSNDLVENKNASSIKI